MNNNIIDISWPLMLAGFLFLLIPTIFLSYYKTGLVKDTLTAALRMVVQLFLIGFYLEYMFLWNSWWLNLLWIIIMAAIAAGTVLNRTQLPQKILFVPVMAAFIVSIAIVVGYLLLVILRVNVFETRYLIPISGMILGNMLKANVIALNAFYGGIERERQLYFYNLGNGATRAEARAPFMRQALIKSFNPTIAAMAVMGLIAMPGTMTGQILGGSRPNVAIKYQIMLTTAIFASSLVSVLFTIWMANRRAFDSYGMKRF